MGDKVKANVQWCLQFIPPQRAVNYAEQARRHRQAGVNGERKLSVSPGSFPFSAQLTSSMSHRISGGACRGDSFPQHAQLLVPSSDSGSKVCHREQPTRAPPSPCQTAASSWDAGCRGAVELHSGAPRTCKLPMMFILQATKHFVAGSFIPAG